MVKQQISTQNSVVGKPFPKGVSGNPKGRPPTTPEQKLIKKATKDIINEYKESLAEVLPELSPIMKEKALNGDIAFIKELHEVTEVRGGKNPTMQINLIQIIERINNILDGQSPPKS